MVVTLILFLLVTSLYIGWVIWLFTLWLQIPERKAMASDAGHLSIVIPFRNEIDNLSALIRSLKAVVSVCQNIEIIFIDDDSSDDSVRVIEQFQREQPGVLLHRQHNTVGKKSGVDLAVSVSNRPWIVALDADVNLPENWLTAVAAHTAQSDAAMLILPLRIGPASNNVSHLQEVEFLSVMGVTATMAFAGKPILCNGANLCFRKEAYDAVRAKRNDFHITSGDDLFLLHALKAEYGIEWIHDVNTIVTTQPHTSAAGLVRQRLRWMGKTARLNDSALRNTAYLTFCMNALLLIGFCCSVFYPQLFSYMLLFFGLKVVADASLIVAVGSWMCIKRVKRFYALLIFIYPLYATLFPLISILYKPTWKERATNIA
jgi:cellulose synthase/poly-beta-1,6-N-acetylglucosamine synthase-like glycosyltransferase